MPDASHDFGAHLRQAREQRGVSLQQIAARTKISVMALEALERNDISRLPGGIFTRAFVRGYAQEVGLDPEDTVRRFLARFPDESFEEIRHYEPNPDRIEVDEPPTFSRAWRMVAWSVPLVLVVAYFGFGGRLPWWRGGGAEPVAKSPEQPKAAPSAPVGSPPSAPASSREGVAAEPPAATQATAPAGGPPAADATSVAAQAIPAGAAPVSPASPVAAPPGGAAVPAASQPTPASTPTAGEPAHPGAFRLTLVPREACWVSVRVNGASVFAGLMKPGERKDLALHGDVSLTVGDAGAFGFYIDDHPGRLLGGPGQVVTARLTAENLKTFLEAR